MAQAKEKAVLIMTIAGELEDSEEFIGLDLLVNGNRRTTVWESNPIDEANPDVYKEELTDAINMAFIYMRALNLDLSVDESIYLFVEGKEEETKHLCDILILEL